MTFSMFIFEMARTLKQERPRSRGCAGRDRWKYSFYASPRQVKVQKRIDQTSTKTKSIFSSGNLRSKVSSFTYTQLQFTRLLVFW